MGLALELVTARTVAPGAVVTSAVALAGNSLTVRDSRRQINIVKRWDTRQAAGVSRLISPLLHDSVIGFQRSAAAGVSVASMPLKQSLRGQDSLTLQMTGSAVAGDMEFSSLLVLYDDLPGVSGRFLTRADVDRRAVNLLGTRYTLSSGFAGEYSGGVSISSANDVFKANTDYALIGYEVSTFAAHAVRIVGPDWGNLGVGGPGLLDVNGAGVVTGRWFYDLNVIPVMSSANRGLTTLDCVVDENSSDPVVTLLWVELS